MSTQFDVALPRDIPADIQVLSGSLSDLDDGSWVDVLTHEEHDRRASFRNEARRRLFTLGRLVLRQHLGERLDLDPAQVPISIHESGRLVLDAGGVRGRPGAQSSHLQISLAHSGERAIAASGNRPLGVDIEIMKPRTERLLDYITHADERPLLGLLAPTAHEQLHAVWTIKEAVLKGSGTGLRTGPRHLRITARNPVPTAAMATSPKNWRLAAVQDTGGQTWNGIYHFSDDYAVAVAWG